MRLQGASLEALGGLDSEEHSKTLHNGHPWRSKTRLATLHAAAKLPKARWRTRPKKQPKEKQPKRVPADLSGAPNLPNLNLPLRASPPLGCPRRGDTILSVFAPATAYRRWRCSKQATGSVLINQGRTCSRSPHCAPYHSFRNHYICNSKTFFM